MAQEEERCIRAFEIDKNFIKAIETAIYYAFLIFYEKVIDVLRNSTFHFETTVFIDRAQCGALEDMIKRNLQTDRLFYAYRSFQNSHHYIFSFSMHK